MTAVAVGLVVVGVVGCSSSNPVVGLPTPPPVPPRVEEALDVELAELAAAEVRDAAGGADPLLRANAAEAAGDSLPDVLTTLLDDEDARVRFAAAMEAGRRRVDSPEVRAALVRLADGESPNGRVAGVFALHMLGDTSRSQRLAAYARSLDPVVRANTAVALGLTGEPSAVPILQKLAAEADGNVRLNALEALWRLDEPDAFPPLLAASLNQFADDNVIATQALGVRDDLQARAALRGKLTDDYPEVRLAAARSLGLLGSDAGLGVVLDAVDDDAWRRRQLASAALGAIGRSDTQPSLETLLADESPAVRLAAAAAVLELHRGR
jgi:HEAT repeat protein